LCQATKDIYVKYAAQIPGKETAGRSIHPESQEQPLTYTPKATDFA
jgi:hypothetical protein